MTAAIWSTTVVLTPGARPIYRRLNAAAQLAIVPVDTSASVRLRPDFVSEVVGRLPSPQDLVPPGFCIIADANRPPVAYLVTFAMGDIRELIRTNLAALLRHLMDTSAERIWLPLMGIEGGGLSHSESLGLILAAIADSGAAQWEKQRFIIALGSDGYLPSQLAELRAQVERTAERDVLDMAGAISRLGIKLDNGAEALLQRAGGLMWHLRPPFDNGRISSRLILFALLQLGDERKLMPEELSFWTTLHQNSNWRTAASHYFFDAAPPAGEYPNSPILFSPEAEEILRLAADRSTLVSAKGISLALMEQAKRDPPDESSARRALDRMGVSVGTFWEDLKAFDSNDKRWPVEGRRDFYPGFASDIPNAKGDALHARAEAVALARVAALRDTPAPLAIGIFGDWGAGKSSFMETVHDVVAADLEGREPYHTKIVQIRFNAWHYIETNLWASLVSHVFAELDRELRGDRAIGDSVDALHSGLATVKRSEVEQADRVIAAQARLDQALSVKPTKSGLDLVVLAGEAFKVFYDQLDPSDRAKIDAGVADLGITEGREAWQRAEKAAREAQSLTSRAMLAWGEMRRGRRAGDAAPIVWCATLLGALILASLLGRAIAEGLGAVLGVFSGIGTAALAAAIALAKLPQAAGGVLGLFEQLNRRRKQADDMALAAIETEIAAARAALVDAVTDFRAATPLGRLTRFIRDKAADEVYAKHLGLVAMIRKDFELLTACIVDAQSVAANADQGGSAEEQSRIRAANDIADTAGGIVSATPDAARLDTGLKPYGRIILYIDDLDRCTTEKVVEVLQAVHLLLAFRLFVVFVAVDYRWVRGALERAYSGQLRVRPTRGAEQAASAADYLEKIFQIPYWVRRLDPITSEDFLRGLIAEAGAGRDTKTVPGSDPVAASASGTDKPVTPSGPDPNVPPTPQEETEPRKHETAADRTAGPEPSETPGGRGDKTSATPPPPIPLEPIEITKDEQELMATLAPYAGRTPRQLKRFFNVYRVVKASTELGDPKWRAILVLLAMTTRSPARFPDIIHALQAGTDMDALRTGLRDREFEATEDGRACLAALDAAGTLTPADLRAQLPIVARFSFCAQLPAFG